MRVSACAIICAAALSLSPLGAPVSARSPGDLAEVRDGLFAVAVGNEIQRNCATISPRAIRVYTLFSRLESSARAAGFSATEIDDYVDDDVAKANLEAEAGAYLSTNGVVSGNETSYCTLGLAEIAAGSDIGRLLRAR